MTLEFKPHALTLDIFLPDMAGWRVLDRLMNDLETRHIPVAVISTDEARQRAFNAGAIAFVPKPLQNKDALDVLLDHLKDFVRHPLRKVGVVDKDAERRRALAELVSSEEIEVVEGATIEDLLPQIPARPLDCVITGPEPFATERGPLDEGRLDGHASPSPQSPMLRSRPLLVYRAIGQPDGDGSLDLGDPRWRTLADAFTVRQIHSKERLLDQASFFLHRNLAKLPAEARRLLTSLHQTHKELENRKVLIVDDDIRKIFALSTVLEDHSVPECSAGNGRDAIDLLRKVPDIDIVLMDIMMPEMDGFETMREIRKIPSLKNLPIIAVTAKAMKGDREKCIEAGAWDYLSKPVDTEQMLAVLRARLHR